MMPIPALIAIAVWGISSKGLKIVSLSSLIGLVAFVIASYMMYPDMVGVGSHAPIWIIAGIIFYKHIPNLVRVFNKEELKVG
jgi:glycerol-3-phosphate acyltransferase PlsY